MKLLAFLLITFSSAAQTNVTYIHTGPGPEDFVYDVGRNRLIVPLGGMGKEDGAGFLYYDIAKDTVMPMHVSEPLESYRCLGINEYPGKTKTYIVNAFHLEEKRHSRVFVIDIKGDSVVLNPNQLCLDTLNSSNTNNLYYNEETLYVSRFARPDSRLASLLNGLRGSVYRGEDHLEEYKCNIKGANSFIEFNDTVYMTGSNESCLMRLQEDANGIEKIAMNHLPILGGDNITQYNNTFYTSGAPQLGQAFLHFAFGKDALNNLVYELVYEGGEIRIKRIIYIPEKFQMGYISNVVLANNRFYLGQAKSGTIMSFTENRSNLRSIDFNTYYKSYKGFKKYYKNGIKKCFKTKAERQAFIDSVDFYVLQYKD